MKKFVAMVVLMASMASGAVLATTTAASAATGPYMSTAGAHRGCTNLSLPGCASQGTIAAGTAVTMHCWIDDSWATGAYRSNRWFYVTTATGVRNFVHSSNVGRQTTVPHCGTSRGVSAARWASMQIGETRPSNTAEKAGNTSMDRWSGWCYVLAWDSHALSHGVRPLSGYGSAKGTFFEYRRRGKVSTNVNPATIAIGSIVFWTNGTYGHAAIYVGQGKVVTTQGNGSSLPPNARLPMSNFGTPAGWVSPANI